MEEHIADHTQIKTTYNWKIARCWAYRGTTA